MRFVEGLTQSEIAVAVGVSQMHVSRLLSSSLQKLREGIGRASPSGPSDEFRQQRHSSSDEMVDLRPQTRSAKIPRQFARPLSMVQADPSRELGVAMVHLDASLAEQEDLGEKGLKGGALGLISSVVVGVASTAPAYSLAATLGFVVIAINGLQAPIITILAFIPMLLHLLRLQGDELRRPRLRDHLHLGRPGLRSEDRAGWGMGHRGRRRARHGQPGPDRRPVRLPPLQCRRHRQQPDAAAGCCWSASPGSS